MTWEKEFNEILEKYNIEETKKSDALAVYYISKYFDIDDFDYLWNEKKVSRGGGNDRKIDLFYLNNEDKYVVIAQSYCSSKDLDKAPKNKAMDLNTAVNTVFNIDTEKIKIDFAYQDLKDEIQEKIQDIEKIYIFYIHNLPESDDINKEMYCISDLTAKLLSVKKSDIQITSKEIGIKALENEFNRKNENIIIKDEVCFTIEDNGYFVFNNNIFDIVNVKISGKELYNICNKYKNNFDDIFSANLRNYLGSSRKNKINQNILKTIKNDPDKFYIFNNGITILTNEYSIKSDDNKIILNGFSIINGAQTTGSICSMEDSDVSDKIMIQARIIKKPIDIHKNFLNDIILFNNTQNQIESADLRSNDSIQKNLIKDFGINGYNYTYSGGKRGGKNSLLLNDKLYISHYKVGQLLWAFHTENIKEAYNNRRLFFENDEYYNKIFTKELTSRHIIFLYTVFNSIIIYRNRLTDKVNSNSATTIEIEIFDYLNKKGIEYIILHSYFDLLEAIYSTKINDKYNIKIRSNIKISDYIQILNNKTELFIKKLRNKFKIAFQDNNSSCNLINRLGDKENINKCIEEIQTEISIFDEDTLRDFSEIKNFLEIL